MKKFVIVLLVSVLMLTLAACGGQAPAATTGEGQVANTITVNASSEVKVTPDKADFWVDVYVTGDTAEEAQKAGVEPVNAVIAALKAAGVDEKSIQTTYTNGNPTYDWSSDDEKITGYEMRTNLKVSGVSVDEVSSLMQTAISAGATGVDGPAYSTESYDEAYQQALSEAVAAAKPKAEAMASAAGVSLGKVVMITEGYQDTSYRYAKTEEAVAYDSAEGEADMGFMPGEISVTAQVTVAYSIR